MQAEANVYQPQLIEETEALLATPFFRRSEEYNDLEDLTGDEYGFKRFIYRACCRVLAEARAEDRQLALGADKYDAACWNESWELNARKIGEIAFRYEDQVTFLSRQLALVNGVDDYIEEHWDTMRKRLREDQQMYMYDIVPSLRKPPRKITFTDEFGDTDDYAIQGTTIVAPTGFGKTRLMEACAKMLQPSQPLLDARAGHLPRRVLVVTPSIVTLRQNAAALRKALPDITVGEVHADKRETDADMPVVTIEMFNRLFEDGKLDGNPVDAIMVDEAHHLSEPKFRQTFVQQWRGTSLVFTATPAYDLARDVRAIIPHVVEKSDIMACIERGTLNDGQIFTFVIDSYEYDMLLKRYEVPPDDAQKKAIIREVVDTLVIEFMTPLLQEGRRGIVFCEQGAQAFYARRLAERLGMLEINGQPVRAVSMDSYSNNQLSAMEDFHAGKLDVITTVDTGREGLDAAFDFVIVDCNVISRLRGHQIVGRGTRPSERFPVTVYGQFSTRLLAKQFEKLYSIEEAFGKRKVVQGRKLSRTRGTQTGGMWADAVDISAFPDVVQELLLRINHRPISEVFTSVNRGRRAIDDDAISLPDILEGRDITELYAKRLLRDAGFAWQGQIEDIDGARKLVHYYSPAARAFLHDRFPEGKLLTVRETAEQFGLPASVIRYAAELAGAAVTGQRASRNTPGQPPICYTPQEVAVLAKVLKKIPGTQPGDQPLQDVARELGIDEAVVWKLAGNPSKDRFLMNGMLHLTAAEVARASLAYHSVPVAEEGEKYLTKLAEETGVGWQVIERNLTPQERAAAKVKRYKDARGFERRAPHWPPDMSREIAKRMEKFKSRPLPANLLPSSALRVIVRNYGVTPSEQIAEMLAEGGFAVEEVLVKGTRSMSKCLSWQAIAYLQDKLGASKGSRAVKLDYDQLPTGPNDPDPAKIAYAKQIQRTFLRPDQLEDGAEAIE